MKKLPSIYKNSINKNISNNKEYCYLDKGNNIDDVLNKIFSPIGYSYNKLVYIKTNSHEYNTYLVSRNRGVITTIDNVSINISDIVDIKIRD